MPFCFSAKKKIDDKFINHALSINERMMKKSSFFSAKYYLTIFLFGYIIIDIIL